MVRIGDTGYFYALSRNKILQCYDRRIKFFRSASKR